VVLAGIPGAPVLHNEDGTQATSERILTSKAKELKMELKGIYPAMVTPLTPDEQVDKAGMRKVIRYCLGAGVHGVVVMGSTGEFPAMTDAMRQDAIETVLDEINGKAPVVIGCGDTGTKKTLVQVKVDQVAVYRHFQIIADASTKPVVIYNFPQMTKIPVAPDTLGKLSAHPNIIGVKDSSGDFVNMQRFLEATPEKFSIMCGNPAIGVAGYQLGAKGGIFAGGSLVPKLCVDVYEAWLRGDLKTAIALQKKASLIPLMTQFGGNAPVIKFGLHAMGICGPTAAAPMALNPGQEEKIFAWMRSLGLEVSGKAAKA
jgi:4-hydroxy-tetrahydrodipicolinate synthase